MAIDTSIIAGLQQPQNVLAQHAQLAQLQGLQTQNRMADMQFQGTQRAQERQNKLSQLLAQGGTPDQLESALRGGGFLDESLKYGKDRRENTKLENESSKFKVDADAKRQEMGIKANEAIGQTLGALMRVPGVGPQHVSQAMQDLVNAGVMSPDLAQKIVAGVPQDPSQILGFLQTGRDRVMSAKEQRQYTDVDANTKANNETSRANNAATVGASYANAGATREIANATRAAAGMQRDRDTEMKIADDYRAQSKDFKAVGDAYKQINATLDKATTSPAATLAAATKFMKLLDPGSVVRESELGMALQASGVFDRATNYFNTLQRGKVLTPTQVADFKNITGQIYGAAQAGQKQIDTSYTNQAKTYGLRPEMILQDLGQNAPAAAQQAPTLPSGWKVQAR